MTDTYSTETNGQRPVAYSDYLAGMDKNDYPEMSYKDGMTLKFDTAERGLTWLYANRPMVFADMMLHVMGIDAAGVKPAPKRGGK